MLKKLAKTTLATASILAGTALSLASPSHASSSINTLLNYSLHEITKVGVNSSGTAYEMKGLIQLSAEVKVHIYAGIAAHVKNWKTWLRVRTENSSWVEFSNNGVSESYPVFKRPQVVDLVVPLAIPHTTLAPVMVSYCNALADSLRSQGKSNSEIFSQDRTVPVAIDSELSFDTIGLNAPDPQQAGEDDFSNKPTINLVCKGRAPKPPIQTADNFQAPPVDFKIRDIDLFLSTFSNAVTKPNAATTCKKGRIKVRLTASKAGPAKFKLWTKIGNDAMTSKVIDAWASFDGNSGYKAEYVEWVPVNMPTTMQAKAEEMVSAFGKSTPWKDITLPCKDAGGGGLAPNPNTSNPDNPNGGGLPQFQTLKGDFSFVDYGSPKCIRTGKALISFKSPKPDNIHYSLDCKQGSYSGVAPTVPHPAGGYASAALVSFDVEKTLDESCTLRTVAPYGPKNHVTKQHLFQCVKRNVETGSDDIQTAPRPNTGNTRVPAMLIPNALDKAEADAIKRRREAAKKKAQAEAKRKREAAAKRAKEAKKKAQAIAKRKREAAIAKRKAIAAALAKRKRQAALAKAKRKAMLKKRRTSNNSTAARVMRRR